MSPYDSEGQMLLEKLYDKYIDFWKVYQIQILI